MSIYNRENVKNTHKSCGRDCKFVNGARMFTLETDGDVDIIQKTKTKITISHKK